MAMNRHLQHTNRIREVLLLWVAQVWPVAGEGDDNGDE